MLLRKLEEETLCDNGCCRKIACFAVEKEDTPFSMELHLCEDCIKELYKVFHDHLNPETGKRGMKKCGNK